MVREHRNSGAVGLFDGRVLTLYAAQLKAGGKALEGRLDGMVKWVSLSG